MSQAPIPYFDIAAAIIMCITLTSLLMRRLTSGGANRVYLTATLLITLTAITAVCAEARSALPDAAVQAGQPDLWRAGFATLYFTLRAFSAPAYLILIAAVSDSTHRMDSGPLVRVALWVPMMAIALLALTNPFHHLMFTYVDGGLVRGPGMAALYVEAAYYSIIGFVWLVRWRELFTPVEFGTLILLYPVMLIAVIMQFMWPRLRLEMFVSSVALLLVSAFAIHPETRHDQLTDAESSEAFREMCTRAQITEKHMCLAFIEVANMARLRELLSKQEVRDVVRGVSITLSRYLERDDIMYNLHDGLFCIASRNLNPEHALGVAQKAHEAGKARDMASSEKRSSVQMRSCVVRVPEDVPDPDTLYAFLRRYAHLAPQPTVTSFDELSKRPDFALQMSLRDVVNRAIRDRSFEVYYQPIYCVADGRFHSAEALVRLNDPDFGWVSPALFIPDAEQDGSIIDIEDILLEKIFAFLGSIDYDRTDLHYVEANLSVEQCVRPELAGEVLELVHRFKVAPQRLNLEITETSAAYSQEIIESNARQLAQAGISLSLDDYGTGYSNVTRMLELPFTLVKLDKSFVDGLGDDATRTVLAASIRMLKDIGKDVLVEGVETAGQMQALCAMGVDYIQGYHFAKPMPEADFVAFLEDRNA